MHPNLRIEVTSEILPDVKVTGKSNFVIQNGQYVEQRDKYGYNEIRAKNKCIFAIKLAEKASSYLQESNVKGLINEAIEVSWKWVHTEENVGEVLYNFLDNEENGFTLFQEMEEDEKK